MPDFADIAALPDDFAGQARLFPLPNLVLFPHVMQPLHIFEPRYRELLEDALALEDAGAFAIVLEAIPDVVCVQNPRFDRLVAKTNLSHRAILTAE